MPEEYASVASPAALVHLRWSLAPQVGPIVFGRLIEYFGSAEAALGAGVSQLERIEGVGRVTAEQIARGRDQADVEAELALAARHGARILCREDNEYPAALRHIADPPIVLYIRGRIEFEDAVAIGIVGSRRCTIYGREQARRFGYQLASQGMTVVSGLARGVDSESHRGALAAGGRTLAVLGNGLTSIYPPEHKDLADEIIQHGAVLSELPMSTSPNANNFLPRNRIIAGLSLGVLVIEAARRSGSLTTARLAGEYDREIFALPGRVDSDFSAGPNGLIRDQHAKLVTCVEDILGELGEVGKVLGQVSPDAFAAQEAALAKPASTAGNGLDDTQQTVLKTLHREPISIEMIAETSGVPPARVAGSLIGLQLRGLVKQLPGGLFVRIGRG